MSKIIIDNRSDLSDLEAIDAVRRVVEGGRKSNYGKQYCYLTVIHNLKGDGSEHHISAFLNKKSDRFVIW